MDQMSQSASVQSPTIGALPVVRRNSYQVQTSEKPEDPDWDSFVAGTPGGHHVQTSLWAQVKAILGWQAVRVVVYQGDNIVAGAQMLMRSLPVGGAIGYVPKGPVCAAGGLALLELVMTELHHVAQRQVRSVPGIAATG